MIISALVRSATTTGASSGAYIRRRSVSRLEAPGIGHADHDPVRVQEVVDGRALAGELGVEPDLHGRVDRGRLVREADRRPGQERAPDHDRPGSGRVPGDPEDDLPDEPIGPLPAGVEGAHGHDHQAAATGRGRVRAERQAAGGQAVRQQVVEAALGDRRDAGVEGLDPLRVRLDDPDGRAEAGQTGGGHEADVAGPDDRDFHCAWAPGVQVQAVRWMWSTGRAEARSAPTPAPHPTGRIARFGSKFRELVRTVTCAAARSPVAASRIRATAGVAPEPRSRTVRLSNRNVTGRFVVVLDRRRPEPDAAGLLEGGRRVRGAERPGRRLGAADGPGPASDRGRARADHLEADVDRGARDPDEAAGDLRSRGRSRPRR